MYCTKQDLETIKKMGSNENSIYSTTYHSIWDRIYERYYGLGTTSGRFYFDSINVGVSVSVFLNNILSVKLETLLTPE